MGALNSVREILSKLTLEEKATIRTYLGCFMEKGKNSTSKSIKLFDLLVTGDEKEDDELESLIYRKPNSATFTRLAARLKEKILEGLLLDVNIQREEVYKERSRAIVELRKSITQAQILQNRGAREIAESMFEKAIEQAKKYEFYEELLIALRLLIDHTTINSGDKRLNKLLKEYDKYDYTKRAVLKAEINRRRVNAETDFRTGLNAKAEWLREMLDDMGTDLKKTGSDHIGFYFYFIEAQYFQLLRNYKQARKSLLNNQRLLEVSPSIQSPMRLASVLINIADNDLYLLRFDRAIETAELALQKCKKGSFNFSQAIEIMFYARFYKGDYLAAKETISLLIPDDAPKEHFRIGKRLYLLAATHFMLGEFEIAMRFLNLLNPIEGDKEGWNIGIRILSIMTLIELDLEDEASAKIDALKKFIPTLSKENTRLNLIFTILNGLYYNGYVFKAVHIREKNNLELLDSNNGFASWQLKSPEMVIFSQWFFAKATRQKFVQNVSEGYFVKHNTKIANISET